ncbi:hypothetical protein [Lewinella sp. 4G2]|uniref:hypothetical protein n=1 Tax=Lewinella sp. 4G2 TaxID=1803372 RepID=UPI0007B4BAF2|nr:hypothetical protein [Lewinella sp. 4G2]
MIHILSFSTNKEILAVMDRLVNKHDENWTGYRAADLATASEIITQSPIDVVLLGAGTGAAERQVLSDQASAADKRIRFIDHYGGGSGLLYAEVEEALRQKV